MVELRPWIDLTPERPGAATASQLTQADRMVTGTVSEILDDGTVAVSIDGSTEPDVVVPSASGITAVGASVRVSRDSSGRAVEASIPDYIPYGAPVMAVGVTGDWLASLDATTATTSAQVEAAQETADQAAADALASLKAASKAVTGTSDEYALGASETVPPTTGWSTTPPVRTPGTFIWVRTTVTYGDGNTTTTSPVLLTGNTGAPGADGTDGAAGKDGVGLASTALAYAVSTSGTTAPSSGWQAAVPSVPKGQYLWTRTTWMYTDATTEVGYSVAYVGTDGSDGADGVAGKDGVGIESTAITYAASESGTTAPTSGWQAQPPAAAAGQYVWTRTVWTYTDASTETGYAVGKIGEQGTKGDTGATGTSVTSVTTYYRTVTKGTAAPAKPTVSPAPSPWTTTEPAYADNTELYRTDRIVYSTGSFAYTDVSKVSAYTAAAQAITVANLVEAAAQGLVKPSATDPGHYKGRIWLQLDSSGRTIGIKISNGTAWSSYSLMADQLIVPGTVGTTLIADGAITTPKLTVTEELWTAILNVAGDATIGGTLLAQTLVGKILQGGLLLAGGGGLPQVLVGPLSGQVGTGDQYGISITTPNGNANGSAVLAVAPTGPFLEFYDGTGALVLAADKTGVRVINRADGGMVDLSKLTTQRWTWTLSGTLSVKFNNTSGVIAGTWAFFHKTENEQRINSVFQVSSPTGRLRIDSGVRINQSGGTYGNSTIAVQWGLYTSNPDNNDRTDVTSGLLGNRGRAECYYNNTATPFFSGGSEIVDVTPNQTYWVRPFYRQGVMGPSETKALTNMWVTVTPA